MNEQQSKEFQQVAALMCLDCDILLGIAERKYVTLESLIEQVKDYHRKKEEMISNPKSRESRYQAASLILGAVASGEVRCDAVRQ